MTFSPKSIRFFKILGYLLLLMGCAYVLLNPLLGVIEPIPDIIPLIGNVDDVFAIYLIWRYYPRLMEAMNEFMGDEAIPDERRIDNLDCIDVYAETVYPDAEDAPGPPSDPPVEDSKR